MTREFYVVKSDDQLLLNKQASIQSEMGLGALRGEERHEAPVEEPRMASTEQLGLRKIKAPKKRSFSGAPLSPSASPRPAAEKAPFSTSQSDIDKLADSLGGQHLDE